LFNHPSCRQIVAKNGLKDLNWVWNVENVISQNQQLFSEHVYMHFISNAFRKLQNKTYYVKFVTTNCIKWMFIAENVSNTIMRPQKFLRINKFVKYAWTELINDPLLSTTFKVFYYIRKVALNLVF